MKKFLVLPLVMILFCGCAQQKSVTPVTDNISFTVQIDHSDVQYICDATLTNETLKLIVKEPKEIKDLKLDINKNSITAEFMGISYTPDLNTFPQGALVKILFGVFNDVKDKSAYIADENCIITGKISEHEYTFIFSPSGLPISLEIDQLNLSVKFYDVTIN